MKTKDAVRHEAPDGWSAPEAIWNVPAYALAESLAQSTMHADMAALTVALAAETDPAIAGLCEQTRSLARYLTQVCGVLAGDERSEARAVARRNAVKTLQTIALLCREAALLLPIVEDLRVDELRRHAGRLEYLAAVQTRAQAKR
jgi:hypothetical protein